MGVVDSHELEPARFHVPTALDDAVTLVRERASRHGIALDVAVDVEVGDIVADERKVKQIPAEPPLQRGEVYPGTRPGRRHRHGGRGGHHALCQRHGGRDRAGGSGGYLRRIPPGRPGRRPQAGGHGARADAGQEVRGFKSSVVGIRPCLRDLTRREAPSVHQPREEGPPQPVSSTSDCWSDQGSQPEAAGMSGVSESSLPGRC
jgi:hypothetical protein